LRYYGKVPGYYVENFGCRATQADGAALERQFEERGLGRAASPKHASVVVLNTCTVTTAADQDARAAIRRVRRQNPDARIVVTGCYAQRAPEEIAALPGVDLVVGNSHKHRLAEIVKDVSPQISDWGRRSASNAANESASSGGALAPGVPAFVPLNALQSSGRGPKTDDRGLIYVSDIFAHTELLAAPVFDAANERTRPNLKIQDGCDNRCSFCVIPYVRGQSRSLARERIIREVQTLTQAGYREVVISGINLGRWGRDLGVGRQASGVSQATSDMGLRPQSSDLSRSWSAAHVGTASSGCQIERSSRALAVTFREPETETLRPRLVDLIRAILSETSLEKLRISSVEPMDWSRELVELVASSPRIAKHAHVPLQSGSDAVLRRMHRKYRPWHYQEKIEKIHARMPDAAIGADVMVGFPGETDSEFEATRQMIQDLPFTYLHVFTFSARPGTAAAQMNHQVPSHIARERNRILRELASEKKLKFMRTFVGKSLEVITLNVVESDVAGEFTEALTDNYLKLRLKGRHVANRWMRASISDVVGGMLVGHPESLT
jgi:threonylcarbamoyladenosine tRNA methylthiotransferase MtaB